MTSYYQGTINEVSKPEAASRRLGSEKSPLRRGACLLAGSVGLRAGVAPVPYGEHPEQAQRSNGARDRLPRRRINGSTVQRLNRSTFLTCVN